MLNINLTAPDTQHTHIPFKSLQFLQNFSVICVYIYHKYEDMFRHENLEIFIFQKSLT